MSDINGISVIEAKDARRALELAIAEMLVNFQKQTGLVIDGIRIDAISGDRLIPYDPTFIGYKVEIDARL